MTRLAYCDLSADVKPRLYASVSAVQASGASLNPAAPPDTQRDGVLSDLVVDISRRFDRETGREAEAYAPKYDVRLYSGTGSQLMEVDEFVALVKVELNTTPGNPASPTWTDLSAEIASGAMQARPIRYWPKDTLFRMSTIYQDPYLGGNLRLTALYGEAQPDSGGLVPVAGGSAAIAAGMGSLTQAQINALAVNPVTPSGWWIVPEDVKKACAEWVVYAYHAQRAGYGDTASNEAAGGMLYRKGIPPEVQAVINSYKERRLHVAMITMDGIDIAEEQQRYGTPGSLSRWAGWQTN